VTVEKEVTLADTEAGSRMETVATAFASVSKKASATGKDSTINEGGNEIQVLGVQFNVPKSAKRAADEDEDPADSLFQNSFAAQVGGPGRGAGGIGVPPGGRGTVNKKPKVVGQSARDKKINDAEVACYQTSQAIGALSKRPTMLIFTPAELTKLYAKLESHLTKESVEILSKQYKQDIANPLDLACTWADEDEDRGMAVLTTLRADQDTNKSTPKPL
jgi:hypothetical protein